MTGFAVPPSLVAGVAGVLGAVFGSFATVAIARWPSGSTVSDPARSQCPRCGHAIAWMDNIPIVSWMLLAGRCRACRQRIGVRYLFIEVLMAALFVVVTLRYHDDPRLLALLVATWVLVVAAVIDLRHTIIPNRLTLRAPLVVAPLVALGAVIAGELGMLVSALVAGVGLPAVMLALSETFRLARGQQGIGMGDVKLAVTIGLAVGALGGWHVVVFAYAAVFSAVIVAGILMALGRAKLATRIPFGPYLAFGALFSIVAGDVVRGVVRGW